MRTVEIRNSQGLLAENLIYQMRKDGENTIFFLAHVNKMHTPDIPQKEELTIRIQGNYRVICYDPLQGTKEELPCKWENGSTVIHREMFDHDSLLLWLEPAVSEKHLKSVSETNTYTWERLSVPNQVPVEFSEPNVLVLDQAEYAFDDGEWMPREEVLRIDNHFRSVLGYPLRMEAFAQPWVDQQEEEVRHHLRLRYTFDSEVVVEGVVLALENPHAEILFNGERADENVVGWYTDQDILCRALGTVQLGKNVLEIKIPYRRKENIENMFLLGNFGVEVSGQNAVLTAPVKELAFGDITRQKLPFYGGNLEYQIPLETKQDGVVKLDITKFRVPLLSVQIDDEERKIIAFSPYTTQLPVKKGVHTLKITVYGNRVNTFGTLHNCNENAYWCGPNAWRTTGTSWSYEYQLKPVGILKTPEISLWYEMQENV